MCIGRVDKEELEKWIWPSVEKRMERESRIQRFRMGAP